jgi:plasmid stabilization system protein ParE
MAYKILFTEDALVDLEVLLSYILRDNEAAWGEWLQNGGEARMMVHFPIQIFYRIHQDRSLIEILHFWHGSRREP